MSLNFFKKLSNRKLLLSLVPLLLVAAVFIFFPHTVFAMSGFGGVVSKIIGYVISAFVWIIGKILIQLINLVIWVAQYNDFINSNAVKSGWGILRDVCNMFFILILLVIAFATTLNRESYAMKALLPKFIIAAILINFSKLICGIIIDFAQVIMLTFVNGFRDIGGGNLADMLGISKLLSMSEGKCGETEVTAFSVVGTYILALVYVIVATVVITVILFILVMRMVMIWIYVVLSPMAWLLSVLPATQKYANQWWQQFSEAVASGPILAFFIWLSFASVTVGTTGQQLLGNVTKPTAGANESGYDVLTSDCAGASDAGTAENMLKFVISIGLLMGGLMVTKQMGGAIGGIAGGGMGSLDKMRKWAGNRITRPVTDRAKAFQANRENARKEKINAFGDNTYGKYITGKSAVKGAAKIGINRAGSFAASKMPAGLRDAGRNIMSEARSLKDKVTFKKYREERGNRNDINDKRRQAYQLAQDGKPEVYKNAVGDEFNEIIRKDGKEFYGRMVDEVDEHGGHHTRTEMATDDQGNSIERMTDKEYKADQIWTKSMYEAKAFTNRKGSQQITERQKKMVDAGLTPSQLLGVLGDNATSEAEKIAASLSLAVKEGFKTKEQLAQSDKLFGKTNNSLLTKQFNDDVDKKQAYLHYDTSTELGRKKFEKRLVDKKLDVQQAAAYKDKNVMRAYDNALNDKEYVRQIRQIGATSRDHDDSYKIGDRAFLDEQKPIFDKDENIVKARDAVFHVTGDGQDALRGNDGQGLTPTEINAAVPAFLDKRSSTEIAQLNANTFDHTRTDVLKTQDQRNAYESSINNYFQSLGSEKLKKIITNSAGNKKTQRMLQSIHDRIFLNEVRGGAAQDQPHDDNDDNDDNNNPEQE